MLFIILGDSTSSASCDFIVTTECSTPFAFFSVLCNSSLKSFSAVSTVLFVTKFWPSLCLPSENTGSSQAVLRFLSLSPLLLVLAELFNKTVLSSPSESLTSLSLLLSKLFSSETIKSFDSIALPLSTVLTVDSCTWCLTFSSLPSSTTGTLVFFPLFSCNALETLSVSSAFLLDFDADKCVLDLNVLMTLSSLFPSCLNVLEDERFSFSFEEFSLGVAVSFPSTLLLVVLLTLEPSFLPAADLRLEVLDSLFTGAESPRNEDQNELPSLSFPFALFSSDDAFLVDFEVEVADTNDEDFLVVEDSFTELPLEGDNLSLLGAM